MAATSANNIQFRVFQAKNCFFMLDETMLGSCRLKTGWCVPASGTARSPVRKRMEKVVACSAGF
jgi:hypothetical protein